MIERFNRLTSRYGQLAGLPIIRRRWTLEMRRKRRKKHALPRHRAPAQGREHHAGPLKKPGQFQHFCVRFYLMILQNNEFRSSSKFRTWYLLCKINRLTNNFFLKYFKVFTAYKGIFANFKGLFIIIELILRK